MSVIAQAYASVYEGSGFANMARIILLSTAAAITQAGVTSITRKVFLDDTQVGDDLVLTVADVIFDTLQTDSLWTEDATGYNFKEIVDDDVLTDGDLNYEVWYYLEPVGQPLMKWMHPIYSIDVPGE